MYIETVFSIFVNISILQNTWFKFSDASESKTVPCYKVSWCQVLKSKRGGFKLYNTFRRHKYRCQNGTVQALACSVFEYVYSIFELFKFAYWHSFACLLRVQERKEKHNLPIKRSGKIAYTWVYKLPRGTYVLNFCCVWVLYLNHDIWINFMLCTHNNRS